jgi:hypothetical protein
MIKATHGPMVMNPRKSWVQGSVRIWSNTVIILTNNRMNHVSMNERLAGSMENQDIVLMCRLDVVEELLS